MVDDEYMYQLWLGEIEEDKFLEIYFEENKERFESEKIFGLTNTYPF